MRVLFVHGTGVRRQGFDETLERLRQGFQKWEIKVDGCFWAETHGVRLRHNGASIPDFEKTGGEPEQRN